MRVLVYCFFILLSSQITQSVLGRLGTAKVIIVRGKVYKVTPTEFAPIKKGDMLKNGDWIETGENSLAILGIGNNHLSKIKVVQESKVQINSLPSDRTEINISLGGIVAKYINKIDKYHSKIRLKVRAVTASLGIRGTTFFTYIGPYDSTIVAVQEGEVEVIDHKAKQPLLLNAGQAALTNQAGYLTSPQAYPWVEQINWDVDSQVSLEQPKTLIKQVVRSWSMNKVELPFNHLVDQNQAYIACYGKSDKAEIEPVIVARLDSFRSQAQQSIAKTRSYYKGFVTQATMYTQMISYLGEVRKEYYKKVTTHYSSEGGDYRQLCKSKPTDDCKTLCWLDSRLYRLREENKIINKTISRLKEGTQNP